MTQDEIIRMAREAGFEVVDGQLRLYFDGSKALLKPNYMGTIVDGLKEFATIVAAHEREKLAEQEPFDMDDHPPHRLCECRKCMEYFTPLPDCDAFAASGKQIAEQTNTQFMEGYRIGLAEMREKCAKVVTEHAPTCSPHWVSCVVAIRAIKFEGDTGFRPVSEMVAEHKQDPKKAAAIEKAKMRKAEQEPVAVVKRQVGNSLVVHITGNVSAGDLLYAAPQPMKQEPVALPFNCWSTNDGDSWYEHPADAQLIYDTLGDDAKVGDEFEVTAGWTCVTARYRIVSQDDDDFEVECISHPQDNANPVRTKDLTEQEIQDATINISPTGTGYFLRIARAVIAADREKNKC